MAKQVPERRCVLTGESAPTGGLIRFVLGPDGMVVPDIAAKLPGRGFWASADGPLLAKAVADGSLARGASRSLKAGVPKGAIPEGLVAQLVGLLTRRCLDRLGLLNRAGAIVIGFEKAQEAMGASSPRPVRVALSASDAAEGSVTKMRGLMRDQAPLVQPFDRDQLSVALGRDNAVHVLVFEAGGSEELTADLSRLEGVRRTA